MELPVVYAVFLILVTSACAENSYYSGMKYDVVQHAAKLKMLDKILDEKLANASNVFKDFFYNKSVSSAEQTIRMVKEYATWREQFIEDIKVLNAVIKERNLANFKPNLKVFPFLNATIWETQLNKTKGELYKLEIELQGCIDDALSCTT